MGEVRFVRDRGGEDVLPVMGVESTMPLMIALFDEDDAGSGGCALFGVELALILPLLLRLSKTGDGIIADHQGTRKSY